MKQKNVHRGSSEFSHIIPYDLGILVSYLTRFHNTNNSERDVFDIHCGIENFLQNISFEEVIKLPQSSREYKEKILKELHSITALLE